MNATALKSSTMKKLSELAKKHRIAGWQSLSKDQLVKAIAKAAVKTEKPALKSTSIKAAKPAKVVRASAPVSKKPVVAAKPALAKSNVSKMGPKTVAKVATKVASKPSVNGAKSERVTRKIHAAHEVREHRKDLSHALTNGQAKSVERDRIVLMVRDSYWLHAIWQVRRSTVVRAQAAMAEHWHTAKPVLRVMEVDSGPTTSTAETYVREIEIHGGVQNWYIEVQDPPKSYKVEIGYRAANGKYFSIARSNTVSTPTAGASDSIDENWNSVAQDYEKIYALSGGYSEERSSGELQELFEERLRRPMGPATAKYGVGAERLINRHKNFRFEVEAEMIIFGSTSPEARVTLGGEPVKLRQDGTFTVRMAMPDKRQVIPAVAASADGVEQRTIVLAVERNTKVLEPMVKEQNEN